MIPQKSIKIEHYTYDLPADRIAFFPKEQRESSKLLVYHRQQDAITDSTFEALPTFLDADMMLLFNDSRVIRARLLVQNENGAHIEIFCLEPVYPTTELTMALAQRGEVTWKCFVGNAKRWKSPLPLVVDLPDRSITITATKGEQVENAFYVTFSSDDATVTFAEWVEAYGKMPLPPYIKRSAESLDESRYQTVYAHHNGSVAAPTAGLHFSESLIETIRNKGIPMAYATLHVGAGTFKPVSSETIGNHFMHSEQIIITQQLLDALLQNLDKRIIAVGTTVTRTLESIVIMGAKLMAQRENPWLVTQWECYEDEALQNIDVRQALLAIRNHLIEKDLSYLTAATQLMIVPSYSFKLMRGIITNFHQPQSTLLLLIAAFLGEKWRDIYAHAVDENYRFLSYGDANLYL